jgi:hypothetical protein
VPGTSRPALLIASEIIVAVGEHRVQFRNETLEADEMNPMNENGRTPSVPSSWVGLKRSLGTEMEPDVMVTGSADATCVKL